MKKIFAVILLISFPWYSRAVEPITTVAGVIILGNYSVKAVREAWNWWSKKEPKDDPREQVRIIAEKEIEELRHQLTEERRESSTLREQLKENIAREDRLDSENKALTSDMQKKIEEFAIFNKRMYLCVNMCLRDDSKE